MSGLQGIDRHSGSKRDIIAEADGAMVTLSVEADGSGEVMITPAQARSLARHLSRVADDADRFADAWREPEVVQRVRDL